MINALPDGARELVEYRWPDYLDAVEVKHSDTTFTVTLMDLDYCHYTFVLNLSLDGRWTVCPISGFRYGGDDTSSWEGIEWNSNQRQGQQERSSTTT